MRPTSFRTLSRLKTKVLIISDERQCRVRVQKFERNTRMLAVKRPTRGTPSLKCCRPTPALVGFEVLRVDLVEFEIVEFDFPEDPKDELHEEPATPLEPVAGQLNG